MIFNTQELLSELKGYVQSHINFVISIQNIEEAVLQRKLRADSWSVLECLEHLNLYAKFYNNEIKRRLEKSNTKKTSQFTSGYWGHKFAMDMLPKDGMRTMNTFKSKNPIYSVVKKDIVITDFLRLQQELLQLLDVATDKDLTKIKTSITLPLLKFRLGDTFRFVIYHNERHVVQAKKVLNSLGD
ncbi:DinB family protein [Tenacibaculum sp. TC6]|uniref:DinB family protein n=1 Tax=Tenacibaculum sp. TC6 TaxID=3423223 RepID=UPI003D367C23